jgi:hypothetical protein
VVPSANPSGVVLGAITIATLLATETGSQETYLEVFASALIVTSLYWVAHSYATAVGQHLSAHDPFTLRSLLRAFAHDLAVVKGASIPLLALLVSWASGASQQTAINAALYAVVASLVIFEVTHGILWRPTAGGLAQDVGIGVTLGLGVVALHLVLH